MDNDDLIRIEHPIRDSKVTDPKPQELVAQTLAVLLGALAGTKRGRLRKQLVIVPDCP